MKKNNNYLKRMKDGKTIVVHNKEERKIVLNSIGILSEKQMKRRRDIIATGIMLLSVLCFISVICQSI